MTFSNTVSEFKYAFYARQFAYDVLRRFFLEEPSREYLKYFVEENLIDLFPFIEGAGEKQSGIEDIKAYLSEHDVIHSDEHYEDLHWDYTRMFIGPFEPPAPPWESVYVRQDGLLFQATTVEVRNMYHNFGYEIKYNNLEAEDHIGLELDFIFHLNELCLEALENNNFKTRSYMVYLLGEQSRFLRKHLSAFTPKFSQKVIENANTQFYKGIAKLLRFYMEFDYDFLQELLKMKPTEKAQ